MANSTANDWDESSPANTDARRLGALEIRTLREGIGDRVGKEHEAPATSGAGGEHKEGSAKVYYEASAPTLRPDGSTSLGANDAGRLWLDSDDMKLRVWDGNSWEHVAAQATTPTISYFVKTPANTSNPLNTKQTGLTVGAVYLVFVLGTTYGYTGSTSFTPTVEFNGSETGSITIDNAPDGTAPFLIPVVVTVPGDGEIELTSIGTNVISRIMNFTGIRIA